MRILTTVFLTTALALSLGTTCILGGGHRVHFTDENNDGICDRSHRACSFLDENGDGICDNYTQGDKCGQNFADTDNDGICDNQAEELCGNGQCTGKQQRKQTRQWGHGQQRNYRYNQKNRQ